MDAAALAINEQRFASNVKNVVSTDEFGAVAEGNIGEFLKFMPGVIPEYNDEDATTVASISIRGFASNMVGVTTDDAAMASTAFSIPGPSTATSASATTETIRNGMDRKRVNGSAATSCRSSSRMARQRWPNVAARARKTPKHGRRRWLQGSSPSVSKRSAVRQT